MTVRGLMLTLLLVAPPALAAELPREVAEFVARRDRCDHFRGEDAENPARIREIQRGLRTNCEGTDAALARLKQRFAGHAAARAVLDRYDDAVE